MTSHVQRLPHRGRDLFACLEDAFKQVCRDLEPGLGGRAADQPQHSIPGSQGLSSPMDTDLAKQAMLDGIPLRAARRIMAHRDAQTQGIAQVALHLCLPQVWTTAIAATCIGQDQQARRLWIRRLPVFLPPASDRFHSKLRGIRRRTHVDRACVALHIKDAIGRPTARASDKKSCTLTASASRHQAWPAFLKLPMSSLFLVSTLMIGFPAARKACFWVSI